MWSDIAEEFDRLTRDPARSSAHGMSKDRTVKWSVYRIGTGLIRVDVKAIIGTFAADMKRDPAEEP